MEDVITQGATVVNYTIHTVDLERFAREKKEEGRKEVLAEIEMQKNAAYPTLSRKEAMKRLGISEATIILWGKRGLLRKVKHGHACLYFEEDIDRILKFGTERG